MGNQASGQLSDLQPPSVQHRSAASGSKEEVFTGILEEMKPHFLFVSQTCRELEGNLKPCEKVVASKKPRLLEIRELVDSAMGMSAKLHDTACTAIAVLAEAANRVELLANGDGLAGKRLAKELMTQGQAGNADIAEFLQFSTLETVSKRIESLLVTLESVLRETNSPDVPQVQGTIEETRALLGSFADLQRTLKTHKYSFVVSGEKSTDEGIVLVNIENAPFELLSELQPPLLPHMTSVSGGKPQVFEELLAQLQPFMRFQLQAIRDFDNDLKICEKSILAQRPRSLQDVREQVDMTMGLTARLSDLTRGFVAVMAEGFGRVGLLANGDEASGRALAKELIAKGHADDPALTEVLLTSTLENYKKRVEEQLSALERFLRDLASQSPDFPVVLRTFAETSAVLDTLASLWTSLKGHRYFFVLSSERVVDESDLKVVRKAAMVKQAKVGWNPLLKSALAEQNLSRNHIPGWKDHYIGLKSLYEVIKADPGPPALLKALEEDLDQRVLPWYLQLGRELLDQITLLPKVQDAESLKSLLNLIEPVIASAETIAKFVGLNLDLIQGLLEEFYPSETAITEFMLVNWVRSEGRWNPLRSLLSLREGHLDLLRKLDHLQMGIQRYRTALDPEDLEKAGKLREKLLALGSACDDITAHPVFEKVPILEPKKQLFSEQTMEIDLSATNTPAFMLNSLSQPLLMRTMEQAQLEPENHTHWQLAVFLLLGCALYSFNYYVMVIPSSILSKDLHQAAGYGPIFVFLPAVGGLLGAGVQRQWVKSSYYGPLRFAMGILVAGNLGVLLSLVASSQSFSLLCRVLIGAGNPVFLALYFLHCGIDKRVRGSLRTWLMLGQVFGAAFAFLTSGFLCSLPPIFLIQKTELYPAVFTSVLDILLFVLVLCLCPDANLHIQVPSLRSQTDQNKIILAGVTLAMPQMFLECLLLSAPVLLVGMVPEEVGMWVLLVCCVQIPSYAVQQYTSFTIKTHWGLLAFGICLIAVATGLCPSFIACIAMLCGAAIGGLLTIHPAYSIIRAEPPFSEKGSWWNADFAMTIALQSTQLLGGLWAVAVIGLGAEQALFSMFVPAIALFVVGLGTIAVLAPKWPFMENPFN